MNESEHKKYMRDPYYLSKESWGPYVKADIIDGDLKHLGYLSATQGLVKRLKSALTISDENNFRNIISELVENRTDFLSDAHKFIDTMDLEACRKLIKANEGPKP